MSLGAIDVNRSGGIHGMSRWQSARYAIFCIAWLRSLIAGIGARLAGRSGRGQISTGPEDALATRMAGRVAIVTGASRGIGQAIAELLAQEGAKVVCAARTLNEGDHRLKGSLGSTVAAIRAAGGEATAVAADISSEAECLRLVEAARAAYGRIDTLVNNAALNYYIPTADYPTNRWIKAFAINVHAPFILAKAVLPDMTAAGRGAIVNIGSGSAIGPGRGPYADQTVRGGVMYGATKAALERFTRVRAGSGAQGSRRRLRVALAGRADARHRLSQAGRRPRRSARRAALDDGARRAPAGKRAG